MTTAAENLTVFSDFQKMTHYSSGSFQNYTHLQLPNA